MRERTPLSRDIPARLPQLKLIASTAPRNASIDLDAAAHYNIEVMHTRYDSSPTVELTWALILASARNLIIETASVRSGGWQRTRAWAVHSTRRLEDSLHASIMTINPCLCKTMAAASSAEGIIRYPTGPG
jgi:lactate dehydrogenase-like 2-hydroxyacid dehydrogenase